MYEPRPLGQQGLHTNRNSSGVGYVIIPYGVNRDEYVKTCYRTGTVSIVSENGFDVVHRVLVGKLTIQLIDFPQKTKELGSGVIWVNMPNQEEPVVVDVLYKQNEILDINEGSLTLEKSDSQGGTKITVFKTGNLVITTTSERENQASVDIRSIGKGDTGKVNITTNDKINLIAKNEVSVKAPSIKHNKGDQSILRGEETNELLEEFIELVATSVTAAGPLSNSGKIALLKTKLKGLLSIKSKIE